MKKITYLLILSTISWFSALTNGATLNVSTTPELREALTTAATNGEDDTIILADGTYKTTDDGEGVFIYLSTESNTLTLQGSNADNTIISGDNTHRVFHHISSSSEVALNALTLNKLSFADGTTDTNSYGAGVFTAHDVVVLGCIFKNNHGVWGGGLRVFGQFTSITNSQFLNNSANGSWGNGGGVSTQSGIVTVTNSEFISNSSSDRGAGISQNASGNDYNLLVEGTTFKNNTSSSRGGAIHSTAPSIIKNSIFIGNSSPKGGALNSSKTTVLNSIFQSNTNTLYVHSSMTNVVNSIFDGDVNYSIGGSGNALVSIYNSFFDPSSLSLIAFEENNIFSGVNLGFVDAVNGDYHLTDSSDLVNVGTIDVEGIVFPETDMDGNSRVSGGAIDIGPYEFSTTRPTIINFDVVGVRKVGQVLSFVTEATASAGRTIASYEIDNGDDSFVFAGSEFSVTYETSGQRSVQVKVTDDQGEWSAQSLTISIADLTLKEKIEVATETGRQEVINSPSLYGLAFSSEIPVAREAGRQDVISSPSTYDLALASEIPVAREEQVAACLASPSSCGINIPNADVDGNGTQDALTDGLLILRYSFGLTGDSLISGVVAEDATRTTAEEIEAYLATLMP